MKKFLSKINRGLILFVALVIGLSLYLFNLEIARYAEKDEIISACQIYLDDNCAWVVLPEEHRFPGPGTGPSAYISSIRDEVSESLLDTDRSLSYELDRIMIQFETQKSIGAYIRSVSKSVQGSPIIAYKDGIAYVRIETLTTIDYYVPLDSPARTVSEPTSDILALKKQDGEWKIYFSQLSYPIR